MSTVVGQLTIDMVANVARLQRDMEQAKKSVGTAMGSVQKTVDFAKKALIGLGGVLAVRKFASFIQGAIDSADQMSKLSQRIGVSVKDVAGLELAFRQSGLEAGALQQSMARLSVGIANGNRALSAMGVETRNVDGTLKTTRQVLGDVANEFASYQDGAAKSALAIELFGRSGADMIPLLNGGAEALDNFDAMAAKLGLTLDETTARQAELFNDTLDLMGQGVQGVGRQIAAQLLPTLTGLAGEFFNTMSEGDRLKNVANFLSAALRGLYIAGISIIEVFSIVGKVLGGVSAAVVSAMSGNFSQARDILRDMTNDIGEGFTQTLHDAQRAWTTTGDAAITSMAASQGAARRAAPTINQLGESIKKQAAAQNLANKELDDYFKAEEKARLEKEKSIGTAREMVEQIEFETAALQMTNTEREIAIRLRELERRGIREGSREYEEFSKRIREAVIGREAVAASIEQQRLAQASWDKTWDQVAQSFTDALMQGGKSVKEFLISLFRTMVLRPILAPIGAAFGAAIGGPAMAGEAGQTISIVSGFKTAFEMVATGFKSVGATVSESLLRAGDYLATSSNNFLASGGEFLQNISQGAGNVAASIAGFAAGMALNKIISGGFSMGGTADTIGTVAIAVASFMGGPVMGAIVGALVGTANRLFGRRLQDTGLQGEFDTSGFAGEMFKFEKGGLLRSDRTRTSAADPELVQALSTQFQQMQAATFFMAAALGEVSEDILNFTTSIKVSFKGLTQEQIAEKLEQEFERIGNEMASLVPNLEQFARIGETASETLSRLYNSANIANQVFDTLGYSIRASTLATAEMASQLIDLFGGTEQFVRATSDFYREFYTEAERAATTTRQLTEVFGTMGLQLPVTRQAFRDLVEAQDLTTEAGRQTYAALLNLAPAFASVSASMEQLEQVSGDLNNAIIESATVLRERESLERQLLTLQGDTVELRRRDLEALDESNQAILKRIYALQDEQAAAAQAAQVEADLTAIRQRINAERINLENQILQLQGNTTELRRRELEALDPSNRQLQHRIWQIQAEQEAAQKQQAAAEQLRQTMERLGTSIADEVRRLRGLMVEESALGAMVLQSQFATLTAQARSGDQSALERLPAISQAIERAAASTATSSLDLSRTRARLAASLMETAQQAGVPTFAGGGMHMGGMRMVGETGPELEVTGPARYFSASQTANMMGGGAEVAGELRSLREENKAQARSLVGLQSRMTRLLERWDNDGLPEERDVTA